MTPYERSKVLETFTRLQRDMNRGESSKVRAAVARDPQRMQQDLSSCISVGTVKAGPNPHVKLVEKRLGFNQNSDLKFDQQTLKDPKRIIAKVVKMQTQATIEDAEELSSQRDGDIMPSHTNYVQSGT